MIKLAGTFCAGLGFMLAYVLMTGIVGTWELFTYGFVQAALLTVVGYQTVNGPWAEVEGVKATKEGYMAPAVFAVLNAVVLFTGAETLYA
jgi:CO/xanthine dehydrogenase Mo-binding subunit